MPEQFICLWYLLSGFHLLLNLELNLENFLHVHRALVFALVQRPSVALPNQRRQAPLLSELLCFNGKLLVRLLLFLGVAGWAEALGR